MGGSLQRACAAATRLPELAACVALFVVVVHQKSGIAPGEVRESADLVEELVILDVLERLFLPGVLVARVRIHLGQRPLQLRADLADDLRLVAAHIACQARRRRIEWEDELVAANALGRVRGDLGERRTAAAACRPRSRRSVAAARGEEGKSTR